MVHSHKTTPKEWLKFFGSYSVISVFLTLTIVFISYRDVVKLRFTSDFYSGSSNYSQNVNDLAVDSFTKNVTEKFSDTLPVIALSILFVLVAYATYSTFQGIHHNLKVSKLYINGKREDVGLITLRYSSLSIAFFVLPLLYWCFLIAIWFPHIIKFPLRYLIASNMGPFVVSSVLILVLLGFMTHVGIFLCRLAEKMYRQILRG